MGLSLLFLMTFATFIVLGDAVENPDSTAPQVHQQAWRETEDEVSFATQGGDNEPSESQDTRSNYKDHPNNGPLLEEERPRPRNRSRSNGKRRRRTRKRPRTTTPKTYDEEPWQIQENPETLKEESPLNRPTFRSERIQDDIRDLPIEEPEDIKQQHRRRPGRRRRPHHRRPSKTEVKYEEHDLQETAGNDKLENRTGSEIVTNQGRKRKRGNGRRRMKVETEPPTTAVAETNSQTTTTEATPEDKSRYKEPNLNGLIENRDQETTEHMEYSTSPAKTQDDPIELSTTTGQEGSSESTTILLESDETPLPSVGDYHHTEVHYSTTFSTRHASDVNTYASRNNSTRLPPSPTKEPIQETTLEPTRSLLPRFSSKHKLHSRISDNASRTSTTQQPVEQSTDKIQLENDDPEVKIDRKTLFSSSSRRLPPTSAIIRRRLKQKSNNTILNDDEEMKATRLNTEKYLRGKSKRRNEIVPSTLLPLGFKTNPEILSPIKLLEEVTLNEVLKMMTSTTEPVPDQVQTTIKIESKEADTGRLHLDGVELPNIRDEILDLIKSESGSSRLARILQLRNMTLTELLEHRERGSSQLYFYDNSNKRLIEIPSTRPSITTTTLTPKTTPTTHSVSTTEQLKTRGQPTMKIEANVESILEPTYTSNIQFPQQGVQTKLPKLLKETLKHEETEIPRRPNTEDKMAGSSKSTLYAFITETDDGETDKRKPRLFDSMPAFFSNKTTAVNKLNQTEFLNWKPQIEVDQREPFKGEHKELVIAVTTVRPKQMQVGDLLLYNENQEPPRNNAATNTKEEDYSSEIRRFPSGVKSAILASGAVLGLAILGFLTVLVSCRLRQKHSRIRGKRDILCQQLQEDFRSSQCSLSPVLNKTQPTPVFGQGIHSNTTSNRHYYLWRTLRKTFQYE